jgi:hypothetical protein
MAKTLPPGLVKIPGVATFVANAVPDPFDERDLEYRPRLEPLPPTLDQRDEIEKRVVLLQKGNSCTGHAVAAVVNTILARMVRAGQNGRGEGVPPDDASLPRVSPYMLYYLARRYDEFEGEEDIGSSLRGVFKGWFYHGVALEEDWADLNLAVVPNLDDPVFIEKCRDRPLGAFYRVNPYRLDDMQSAISELKGIAVSAAIHDGWIQPTVVQRGSESMYVIARSTNAAALGGHAFALVGYNEVGFLVQNSWGPRWGKRGFATLPYEDWLDSAYDAWVARPGVPRTPFASGRKRTAAATGGGMATVPDLDKRRLAAHVVNIGNDGLLSTTGQFVSTPAQIEKIFAHMERWHEFWRKDDPGLKRHVVFYAHGGMISERNGLVGAQRDLNWWLNNRIYPIYFAWQSGPAETLLNQLVDLARSKLPFGGVGFDLMEQFDRWVEKLARSTLRWMWAEMKENARAASAAIRKNSRAQVQWPPKESAQQRMANLPGASLTVTRLAQYIRQHGADNVRLHLVGHSAGSIFHAALLQRLVEAGLKVESMALLAPAIRMDEFQRDILPHVGSDKSVARLAIFNLSDKQELDDALPPGNRGLKVYHKSVLYLVSRGLEPAPGSNTFEVPLLGMQRYFDLPLDRQAEVTVQTAIQRVRGEIIFSPSSSPADSQSEAATHVDFDGDISTMTSVLMRALGIKKPQPENTYKPYAPLNLADQSPSLDEPAAQAVPAEPAAFTSAVEVQPPGEAPLAATAPAQLEQPAPPPQPQEVPIEVAVAPRSGSPVLDILQSYGWNEVESAAVEEQTKAEAKAKKGSRKKGKKSQ